MGCQHWINRRLRRLYRLLGWGLLGALLCSLSVVVGTPAWSSYHAAPATPPAPVVTRGIGVEARIQEIEQTWETDYTQFLRSPSGLEPLDGAAVADTLAQLNTQTGQRFGLIYIFPQAEGLELVLASPAGAAVRYWLPDVP